MLRSDRRGHHVKVIADLAKYELAHNPDGQEQFVDGKPVDALSNPFAMNRSRYGLLVADGGANDVLRVNPRTGKVSTFFVPPTVKDVPACLEPGAQANPGTVGCDPVPTGIAVARHSVYVSTLGAEVPGAGRVYRLNPRTGKVLRVWKGLTAPTGIAVSPKGTVYVSEVLFNAPPDDAPPPPGFDPASIPAPTHQAASPSEKGTVARSGTKRPAKRAQSKLSKLSLSKLMYIYNTVMGTVMLIQSSVLICACHRENPVSMSPVVLLFLLSSVKVSARVHGSG